MREIQFAAAGIGGHFTHGGGKTAGAVVGNGPVQAAVARREQKIGHLLLGDGVADLHGRHRGACVQFFGRKGGAVDAVLADASAGHDNQIARPDVFLMGGFALDARGHDAGRSAVHQGFAQESLVKNNAAVDGRDAAFVPAVFHPLAHPFVNAARMQDARRQFLLMKRRRKAEYIGIEY